MDTLEETFNDASQALVSLTQSLSSQQLLYFYARYKQATEGPCHTTRPGFLAMKARQKWNVWNDIKTMTQDVAMRQYISQLDKVQPEWRHNKGSVFGAMSVSSHIKPDPIPEADKTIFDYIRDGHCDKIMALDEATLCTQDGNGLSPLHWACDLGNAHILAYLLKHNVNINGVDSEGQTALHYASACYNAECLQMLLLHGADPDIKDGEGCTAADVAANSQIQALFNNL